MRKILIALSLLAFAPVAPVLANDCKDHQAAYEAGVTDGRMDGSRGASENPTRHRDVGKKHPNRQRCYEQGYRIGYSNASADANRAWSGTHSESYAPTAGPKEFSGGVYSPAQGVICDRKAGYCADGTGISMGFTEQYLGHDAMQRFSKQIEGVDFDTTVFVMSNGVKCDAGQQKCFESKFSNEVADDVTRRLFR